MSKLDFWYLASPYSKYPQGQDQAWKDISYVAGRLMLNGLRIFCPIAMGHSITIASGPEIQRYDLWLPQDEAIMQHARGILVAKMAGWNKSSGVEWEIKKFTEWKKPIWYFLPGSELELVEAINKGETNHIDR